MLDYTISQWIILNISIHLACLRRVQIRHFSGYAAGKRRNLSRLPTMISKMADDLLRSLEFCRDGERLERDTIAQMILEVLNGVPAADAFMLASNDHLLVQKMWDMIGAQIANALLDAFDVKRKPRLKIIYDALKRLNEISK